MTAAAPDSQSAEFRDGWQLLLGCALATSIGAIGLFNYATAVLLPYWIRDLGIARSVVGEASAAYSLAVLLCAPLTGALIDRYGVLKIASLSLAAQVVIFLGFAMIPQAQAGMWLVILSGAIAAFAMGTSPIGFARLVSRRFIRSRGLALALMTSTQGVVAIALPLVLTPVVVRTSWRGGEVMLALISAVVGIGGYVLIAVSMRENGRTLQVPERKAPASDWSAVKQPIAWLLIACFFAAPLCATGWLLQYADIAHQRGMPIAAATRSIALIGVTLLVGRLVAGLLLDRLPTGYVAAGFFLLAAAGCAAFPFLTLPWLWIAPMAIGSIIGAEQDLLPFIAAKYFPEQSVGKLYGCLYGAFIFGGGLSVLAHMGLERLGFSLAGAFFASAALLAVAGISVCIALTRADRR